MRTLAIINKNPWHSDLPAKLITGVIVGCVLAFVNHIFWVKQNEFVKFQARVEQKVELYGQFSQSFTRFLTNHNTIAAFNKTPQCDSSCEKEKGELQRKTVSILSELALLSAKTVVLFPDYRSSLEKIMSLLENLDDNPTDFVLSDSKIVVKFRSLLKKISEDIQKDTN
jgi:hypothetical protein